MFNARTRCQRLPGLVFNYRNTQVNTFPPQRSNPILQRKNSRNVAGKVESVGLESVLFASGTIDYGGLFAMMTFMPKLSQKINLMQNITYFVPLIALYGYLLYRSWQPDTLQLMMPGSLQEGVSEGALKPQFFPTVASISTLLSRQTTAASLWLHILIGNLIIGRYIFLSGLRKGIVTFHSLLAAAVFGPFGLLLHFITSFLQRKKVSTEHLNMYSVGSQQNEPVIFYHNGGKIILLPYETQ
eukprot:TRINITY_DN7040_c0_g1_i1.p1 TRINITY_DN7040_c0_g1~~TRINITY_DN7040_c0_g1_i1.p1  ORF type:complete len:242 (-),score=-0.51 TRINITY_DN7040_c0_g1_i1:354-1079(-)